MTKASFEIGLCGAAAAYGIWMQLAGSATAAFELGTQDRATQDRSQTRNARAAIPTDARHPTAR